ncbi:MAG TPA: hypothetical protein VFT89_07170 [Rhizobiaceae bacterium]|nr:hypothetical protein [Rhizobiaceae bacterium]
MTFQSLGEAAAKVVDPWRWWQSALANPDEIGKSLPVTSTPEQGYFRTRQKDGQWEPVAIWQDDDGNWLAYRNGREVRAEDIWTWACRQPISYEQYQAAMDGKGFADEPPAPIGHNSAGDDLDAIKMELAGEIEQLQEFMRKPVETQADADKIGIWSKRLTDIAKRADGFRVVEKEPHLAASRAVDDKWRDPITAAKEWATKAKRHIEPFLIAEKRKRDEEARKAREEAERQRLAKEADLHAKIQAAQSDPERDQQEVDKLVSEAERLAKEPLHPIETKNASAGRTGARISVRVEKVGVVTDYAKAAAALVAMKHRDMTETIDKLAQRAAKSGMAFDGMEIREQEKVQ